MAATNAEILGWLQANPTATDSDIANAMAVAGVNPAQLAQVVGVSEGEVVARVAATIPQGSSAILGDTIISPEYRTTGSGETQEIGNLETIYTSKTTGDVNYRAPVGSEYQQYGADGTFQRTGVTQDVNATKDFMDFVLTAGTLFGLPAGIGQSLGLGSGAVSQAVGQGLLTTGTKLGGGENLGDALKAGLIGGGLVYGGAQLGDYVKANTPIDASNMTQAQFNDAIESKLVSDMQSAGLSKDQINAFFDDMGIGQGLTTNVATPTIDVPSTADNVQITGTRPTNVSIGNPFITTPTLTVTAPKTTPTTQQDVINAINTTIGGGTPTTPEVKITADRPKTTTVGDALAAITTLPTTLTTTPVKTTTTTDPTKKDTPLTPADIIKLISIVPAIAAITKIATPTTTPPTGFDVVPVPASFGNPPAPTVAPYSPLAPINFGNRNLLRGTQWEKFLDPNYGQVPEPVQYSQPSNLSYNDLMGILGSKQGMPSRSSLSINDVISGIQNQYGQVPTSTMG